MLRRCFKQLIIAKKVKSRSDGQWAANSTSSTEVTSTGRPRPPHARAGIHLHAASGFCCHTHTQPGLSSILFLPRRYSTSVAAAPLEGGREGGGLCNSAARPNARPRLCRVSSLAYLPGLCLPGPLPSIPSSFQPASRTSHLLTSTFTTSFHHLAAHSSLHQSPLRHYPYIGIPRPATQLPSPRHNHFYSSTKHPRTHINTWINIQICSSIKNNILA